MYEDKFMKQEQLLKLKDICEKVTQMDSIDEILKLINQNKEEIGCPFDEFRNRNNNSLENIKKDAKQTIDSVNKKIITFEENNGNN
jgi:hypothetical protein